MSVVIKEEKNEHQCTVSNMLYFKGIGLHSGKETAVIIKPAEAGSGIVFIRKDVSPPVVIKVGYENICSTNLRTSIGKNGACVSTVEHLMSALWGADIDNAVIEVYGEEIPALDGSAKIYYEAFNESGRQELKQNRKYIEILEPIVIKDPENSEASHIAIYPSNDFEILYTMDFDHPFIGSGRFEKKIDGFNFYKEISCARTFGFLKEVQFMREKGLALGGSLDNALVLSENGILNKDGLRYKDEFIRHKVLDLIGDLYLSGFRIKGRVLANRTGHDMNVKLIQKIALSLAKSKECGRAAEEGKNINAKVKVDLPAPEKTVQYA